MLPAVLFLKHLNLGVDHVLILETKMVRDETLLHFLDVRLINQDVGGVFAIQLLLHLLRLALKTFLDLVHDFIQVYLPVGESEHLKAIEDLIPQFCGLFNFRVSLRKEVREDLRDGIHSIPISWLLIHRCSTLGTYRMNAKRGILGV